MISLGHVLIVASLLGHTRADSTQQDVRPPQSNAKPRETCITPMTNRRSKSAVKPPAWIVVMNAVTDTDQVVLHRTFSMKACSREPVIIGLWERLEKLQTDTATDPAVRFAADAVLSYLDSAADDLALKTAKRWVSTKGDRVDVYVLHDFSSKARIQFTEESRNSRLESDLTTLVAVATKIGQEATLGETGLPKGKFPKSHFSYKPYSLQQDRANLTIAMTTSPEVGTAATPATGENLDSRDKTPIQGTPGTSPTPANEDSTGKPKNPSGAKPTAPTKALTAKDTSSAALTTTLITGLPEHVFLSANAGIAGPRELTYDETTKALQPGKKPTGFAIAVNYSFGDLFADGGGPWSRIAGASYVGMTVAASKQPFDQLGAVVGFRYMPLIGKYLQFDTVSPYIGVQWSRVEALKGSSAKPTVKSHYGVGRFSYGLSLNLDKALGWLGSGDVKPAAKGS